MAKKGTLAPRRTSYDGSPLAGQMTLFDEYNSGENGGNGHRTKPKAIAIIVDHVKDENNDSAADIEDLKLFLKRNGAARERYSGYGWQIAARRETTFRSIYD